MLPDIGFMVGGEAGQWVQSICHCGADEVSRSNLGGGALGLVNRVITK